MIGLNEIQPGETLAIDIRKLRDDQVKDQNGQMLPKDLLTGHINWRIHDGAQIVGRTQVLSLNSAIAQNRSCGGCTCQPTQITVSMDNFTDNGDGTAHTTMRETDYACDEPGFPYAVPNYYFYWYSDDPSVATVDDTSGLVTYQGPGATAITASAVFDIYACQGPNPVDDGCYCPPVDNPPPVSDSKTVTSIVFVIHGNGTDGIFVGSDPQLATPNLFACDSASPSGGTLTATSSDSNDTFKLGTFAGLPSATIATSDQSTSNLDRTLTFKYTVGTASRTRTLRVTARKFSFVTNTSPSNQCSLGFGYKYVYIYTPYTHPDGIAVQPSIGLGGTAVTEALSPTTIACGGETGDGALNANSQFTDTIAVCSTSPVPACSSTHTQVLKIAGFAVRTNLLTISNTSLAYTNQGPNQ
jgi:hypothetical protein